MKLLIVAGILFGHLITAKGGNFFKDYLKNRYPIQFVHEIPAQSTNQILMISSRYFKPQKNYLLKRGIQPWFQLFYFKVALKNDTAWVQPLEDLNDAKGFFPNDRDFLVYIDGHGKTFGQTMERGFELTDRFNINMVIFDWPSDYLALRKTIYNADEVAVGFVEAMRTFNDFHVSHYNSSMVSVIFHSMGNRILKDVAGSRLIHQMPDNLFSNIIINAAAVKQQNHAKWVERLNIQKRIYITKNNRDFNLRGAAILRCAEQLGLGNHNFARNAWYVNFSVFSTIDHNLFLGRSQLEKDKPEIFTFYDLAFHGKEVSFNSDTGLQILSPSDRNFLFSVR
ncbi:MAG TPA: alpha/beta hydrolase [Bacteroidales bacterium]|nr:alpha/beta hydrolase [Bacteroidales bacterium]